MNYIKIILIFLFGMIVSYFIANIFDNGASGVFTAICYFGALFLDRFDQYLKILKKDDLNKYEDNLDDKSKTEM